MSSPASIISILGPILAGILNLRRFWARCSTISWNIVPTIHVFKYVFMEETHKVSFTRVSLHFSCVVFTSILLHTVWCSVKSSSRRLRYVRFYWNGTFHCITHLVHSHYKPTYFTSSFTKMWHSILLFLKATSVYGNCSLKSQDDSDLLQMKRRKRALHINVLCIFDDLGSFMTLK